jgi:hypothetical protein
MGEVNYNCTTQHNNKKAIPLLKTELMLSLPGTLDEGATQALYRVS